ncbi:MAG: MBL fold metallo-hydrolase [Pseudorhodoplanes sp.]|uniref:MBL fold metallo-hydrolase n=1 Tax=Pseudorhodoplanes sp. TaxID=1934341 RepID=UPI003D11E73C
MISHTITRRSAIAGLSTLAAAVLPHGTALAKAPMLNTQAPAYYRYKLGSFEVTVVSDGPLGLGALQDNIFAGISKADFTKILHDNYLPSDAVEMDQNVVVVNTGEKLVLFDTGDGGSTMFGPKSGRLIANLRAAGIDPKEIDVVALTHAHPDHCWGLMATDGKPNFPNAQIALSQADFDFWTDEGKAAMGDMMKALVGGTRRHLIPNRERIAFVTDGQEVVPGIRAIATPGHTVGHLAFAITSGGKTLVNTGDVAHHHIVSMQQPRAAFSYDTDGAQGVASRLRTFDMLATDRLPFVSYHFPWPGLGYVARHGDAYRYFPAPMQTVL